jgi:hypothetical protein
LARNVHTKFGSNLTLHAPQRRYGLQLELVNHAWHGWI